ncbi:MAG TPA: hypothetical protein VMZ33_05340 [Candidatus Limnocylindrales bacterium]|nr:hypothetical protein [Candidatus Limnocylindrales bacterium]
MALPVPWDTAFGPRRGLVQWMAVGSRKDWPFAVLLVGVMPEPVLVGLEALDDRMVVRDGVLGRVLRR